MNLQDAILDEAMLARLFFDVAEAGQLLEIVLKGAAEGMTPDPTEITLDAAFAALRERRVFGVQLRYCFGGSEWWDTLMVVRGGVRLVRIDHTAALAAVPSE